VFQGLHRDLTPLGVLAGWPDAEMIGEGEPGRQAQVGDEVFGLPRGASAMTAGAGRVSMTIYTHLSTSRRQDLAQLLAGLGEEPIK
jgi:hypothetical protein